ncbi:MAG TPA: hypothetical protein VFW29_10340 [Solirubrobacteraceae bacterium]|nr:hypothetical protein [Solirubrobacteraceae bacterium]
MRARDEYRLIVTRAGHVPAWLAHPSRIDHVEVVEVRSGEVVLFWDRPAAEAARLARAVRRDLLSLDGGEFIARWSTVDG